MSHNNQKKIAVINDFSGFGRCSLAVEIPIISKLKVQCCPVPTSLFSNHTGFKSFFMRDLTGDMPAYINEWSKLGLEFSGISTGFLGSADQIKIVKDFLQAFKRPQTVVVVDPVMGDYGKAYQTYTAEMCRKMRQLIVHADIITPNLTEACLLADMEYREDYSDDELFELAAKLSTEGPDRVVITGLIKGQYIRNLCYIRNGFGEQAAMSFVSARKTGPVRSGTGDLFSAVISADAVNGVDFVTSVTKAARFINQCLKASIKLDIPLTDGVCFEEVLDKLK